MKQNDKKDVKEVVQSNVVDLSFIFLIIKAKFLFFAIVSALVSIILVNKSLKENIYFTTQGVAYIEKNSNFLNSKQDKLLKKLIPTLDEDSRKQLLTEFITSSIVIRNAVMKSGYNVYLSKNRDSSYKTPNFSSWKNKYKKNIKNLIPSNKSDKFYVNNATINNIYSDKVELVIKFMDYEEFKIFDKLNSKYLATSSIDKQTNIGDICSFILHREKEEKVEYFDPKSPLLELPEPIYLTINNQNSYRELKGSIKITSGESALVEIETKGDNPYMLNSFTKNLMTEFISLDIDLKLKNMDKVHNFMQKEMDILIKKQNAYMDELREIRKKNNSIVDDQYFVFASSSASKLKGNMRAKNLEIKKLENYRQHLVDNKDITKLTLAQRPRFSSIATTSTQFDIVLNKFLNINLKYTPNSRMYIDAKRLVEKQKELLILAVEYKIKELKMEKNRIMRNYENSNNKILLSMDIKDKIDYIKKQIEIIDSAYLSIYESDRSLIYNKVFIKYSNKIITEPSLAKKPTNKIVSKITINIVIGMIIGVIITIIKHTLFSLFLSRIVVSKMTPSLIMGGIPKIPKKSITPEGLIDFSKEDKIAELFTTMETLIFFNHPEIKTIQFTSPYPKDGKTFVARNMAQSLASNNAKVILVNMNLDFEKKQKLNKIDSVKDLKKSIKKIKLYNKKDLYILPFNTTEKNMHLDMKLEKYKKIFTSLKNSFDYIILDTPQYPMYSESLSLSSIVDLSISVVKLNHTPVKVSGKHFRDIASFSKKHIIIINNDLIDINSSGYTFIDKKQFKYHITRLKQKISQI
ncbi:MAG: hypothetical protein U9N02_00760 [Campylobacterota bacterium]|nr:hypothetical protein [Campylobacterota bacterium]